MKQKYLALYGCILALLGLSTSVYAETFSAKTFSGADEKLDQSEAALYIAYRDKEPLANLIPPNQTTLANQTTLDLTTLVAKLQDKLDDLRSKTGHEAPWSWQELDNAYPPQKTVEETSVSNWKNIEGFTKEKKLVLNGVDASLGPIRLRKSAADLLQENLKDSNGATVGFTNNRLINGNGAWNTEGIMGYPMKFLHQGGEGRSTEWEVGPAIEWRLVETEGTTAQDVQDLGFSLPMAIYMSPGRNKMTGSYEENIAAAGNTIFSSLWVLQGKPYFQTDFSFGYKIYGIQSTAEFIGGVPGSSIYLGGFQNLGNTGLQYQLRVIPELDYSVTDEGGRYTTRKPGDDWFRIGGLVSLDFRLGGDQFNPIDIGASYRFLETVNGSGNYADLFKTHATWWLIENVGLTLEYSKGEAPVSIKKLDLIALLLELKY